MRQFKRGTLTVMQDFFNMRLLLISIITLFLTACAGAKPNIYIPSKPPKPLTLKQQPRVAIVLGGGGARGYAHIGVLKVLQKAGIPIDLVVGSSAGSLIGSLYADSGNANKVQNIMMRASFWDFADISNFPSLKGPIKGYHFQKFLLRHMQARQFRQLKKRFVTVATNLKNGKMYVIDSGPIPPAVEASAAIPGAVQPVHLYGKILIDGSMVNPIPADVAKRYHPKVIIAVNISQTLPKHLPLTAFGIYDRAYKISWLALSRLSERDADIVIRPNVGQVGTFDISQKRRMLATGERTARRMLPAIKRLLKQKGILLTHENRKTS